MGISTNLLVLSFICLIGIILILFGILYSVCKKLLFDINSKLVTITHLGNELISLKNREITILHDTYNLEYKLYHKDKDNNNG